MSRAVTYTLTGLESAVLRPWAGGYLGRPGAYNGVEGVAREILGLTSGRHAYPFLNGDKGLSLPAYQRLLNHITGHFPATAAALETVASQETRAMLRSAKDYARQPTRPLLPGGVITEGVPK